MQGILDQAIYKLFGLRNETFRNHHFLLSFFEIYSGKCLDLFDQKKQVEILEDHTGNVVV